MGGVRISSVFVFASPPLGGGKPLRVRPTRRRRPLTEGPHGKAEPRVIARRLPRRLVREKDGTPGAWEIAAEGRPTEVKMGEGEEERRGRS